MNSRTESTTFEAVAETMRPPQGDGWDYLVIAAIFSSMFALAWAALATPLLQPLVDIARRQHWTMLWVRPTVIWITMGMLLLLLRTILWLLYRPFAAVRAEDAPQLTVVIPAYNESAMVEHAIASVALARYPRERLEIIAVDDGSTDDTWRHIQNAALRHPGLVTPIRLPANLGKRGALAEGFRRATGEIIVTVDSDSVLSFDYLRSAQSVFRTVYCCPGALAAYRASVVRRALPAWERQSFLGAPCTYGEDRALTNDILALGYDTAYQRSAVVHTLVPETYSKLCRMFLRWDRSYIREEFRFARIVWKRPLFSRVLALYESTITNLRYPVAYASIALWAMNALTDPGALVRMLLAIMVVSLVYVLYYLRSERAWDFAFGILYAYFSFFALTWIFPYAVLTVRARGWLTR